MAKIMIFIDGTWLYSNQYLLSKRYGGDYKLDYGKLPNLLGEIIAENLGETDVDIVRTYLYGSNAKNYHIADEYLVQQRRDFFDILKEEYHYEVEAYPIDYKGRRLRKKDRDTSDNFYPQEKCVDIALATSMLYFAAIPYAYDIAIAVVGDRDFIPMLQHVRRLGKRVAIASIRGSCASEYSDTKDIHRLKDFDIIWIGDYLDKLELKIERRPIECQSPFHDGNRCVYTTELIRKGQKFYCDKCKEKFRQQKLEQNSIVSTTPIGDEKTEEESVARIMQEGTIKKIVFDKGYGFIQGVKGDYFFHLADLSSNTDFKDLNEGDLVIFEVEIAPNPENKDKPSGKASNVQIQSRADQEKSDYSDLEHGKYEC